MDDGLDEEEIQPLQFRARSKRSKVKRSLNFYSELSDFEWDSTDGESAEVSNTSDLISGDSDFNPGTSGEVSCATICIEHSTEGPYDWETSDSGCTVKHSGISNYSGHCSDFESKDDDLCDISSSREVCKFEKETSDSGLNADESSFSNICGEESSVGFNSDEPEVSDQEDNFEQTPTSSNINEFGVTKAATLDCNSDSNDVNNFDFETSVNGLDSDGSNVSDVEVSDEGSEFKYDSNEEDSDSDSDSDESYISPQSHPKDKEFCCDICGKTFKGARYLQRHRVTHLGGENCVCPICNKSYTRKDYLTSHMALKHSENVKTFTCELCGKVFYQASSLRKHVLTHTGNKDVECEICNRKFANTQIMRRHLRTHYGQRDYKCDQCDKTFARKDTLKVHIISVHQEPEPTGCDICGKVFPHHISLNRHRLIHEDREKVECDICGRLLQDKKLLDRHLRTHYGIKNFECDICGRLFTRKDLMKSHRRVHTRKREKVSCDICGRLFKSKGSFIAHRKSHRTKPKYECSICGKEYPYRKSYTKHMRFHQGVKDYKCEVCGREFQERYHLQVHLGIHADDVPEGTVCQLCGAPFGSCLHTKKKEYQCPICLQVLRSKFGYKTHMAGHTGDKRFECEVCGKKYVQNSSMLKHIRNHHSDDYEKKYRCAVCGKKFLEKESYDKHTPVHGNRNIECNICHRRFTTKTHLRDHQKLHKPLNPKNRSQECKVCGRILAGSYILAKHLKVHYALAKSS